jgi:hypothetical protein
MLKREAATNLAVSGGVGCKWTCEQLKREAVTNLAVSGGVVCK